MQKIDRFLKLMNDRGASDLHLTVGRPPMLRASGSMEQVRFRVLSEGDFSEMMQAVTPERLWNDYTRAYQDALRKCSTRWAPWYVVPSDSRTVRNYLMIRVITGALSRLGLRYPAAAPEVLALRSRLKG